MIMRTLVDLEFLNGLKVERDILEESQAEEEDEEDQTQKSHSPVKEEPFEEDQEDDDEDYPIVQQQKRNQILELKEVRETNEESHNYSQS